MINFFKSFHKNSKISKYTNGLALAGFLIVFAAIPATVILVQRAEEASRQDAQAAGRDPLKWPFPKTSIWNMPLGDQAIYKPIGFTNAQYITIDEDVIVMTPTAPQRTLYFNGHWTDRCVQSGTTTTVPIPDSYTVPDANPNWTPNFAGAFLLPDGRTIVQGNPVARCTAGGPVTAGWRAPNDDIISGTGIRGGHGGSGMSSLGGAIRKGELLSVDPIRHVLKINIDCQKWCTQSAGPEGGPGYRWPAVNADSYAIGGSNGYGRLGNATPGLMMGSLLAIPTSVDINSLGLTTNVAKKVAWTMQNYGAYVVDDAYDPGNWYVHALDIEKGVNEELLASPGGFDLDANSGTWYNDIMKIFNKLAIVDNNSSTNVGGPGNRLQPLAPDFDTGGTNPPPPPPPPPPVNPPPPPTSTGYTIDQLVSDMNGTTQGVFCPGYEGWDFPNRGDGLPSNFETINGSQVTGWGTVQWQTCGVRASGVRIQLQNYKMYGWTGSNWVTYGGQPGDWCVTSNIDTGSGFSSDCNNTGTISSPNYAMPNSQRAIHWATARLSVQGGTKCFVNYYEAKSSGSAALMVNAGADDIDPSATIQPRHYVSRYKLINTTTWTPIAGSNCPETVLRGNPPPGFSGGTTNPPPPPPPPSGALIWCEAESATVISPMLKGNDTSASGGSYLYTTGTDTSNVPPVGTGSASFTINVPSAGNYVLWTRVRYVDGEQNSHFVRFNNSTSYIVVGNDDVFGSYRWVNFRDANPSSVITVNLSAGNNTISFFGREANTRIDKILLTTDTNFVPSGTGSTANCSLVNSKKPGDINGDNLVNSSDLTLIISKWGSTDPAADLNNSGRVDSSDLALVIANWGK